MSTPFPAWSADSVHALGEAMEAVNRAFWQRPRRQQGWFLIGGCLFWALLFWAAGLWYALKYTVWATIQLTLILAAAVMALAGLCWWPAAVLLHHLHPMNGQRHYGVWPK